ncbi:hypothetical protein TNCV_4770391 [Trichonephila clavipes]|nr:hypothetical protein TNCV_4770391 [Trichonephila clavipes]
MLQDYVACKRSLAYLLGLSALGKLEFLRRFRVVRAQVPPLGSVKITCGDHLCGDVVRMVEHHPAAPSEIVIKYASITFLRSPLRYLLNILKI